MKNTRPITAACVAVSGLGARGVGVPRAASSALIPQRDFAGSAFTRRRTKAYRQLSRPWSEASSTKRRAHTIGDRDAGLRGSRCRC